MDAMVILSALLLIAGAGPTMTTAARLDRPHGVAVGADGSFWIGDTQNHRGRLVSPER
jgi:streptogramin lyase